MPSSRTIIHVTLDVLTFDREYQRAVDPNRVRKLMDAFDPRGLGTFVVSLRPDGTRVIVDGQHRATAAINVGYNAKVSCVQYEGLTVSEEASIFLLLNDAKKVQAVDRFRARVIAGEKDACEIDRVLSEAGWTVTQGGQTGAFSAVVTIEKIYNGAGFTAGPRPDLVSVVAEVAAKAWSHNAKGANQLVVGGLGKIYGKHGKSVDSQKLIDEMSKHTPNQLIGQAKSLSDTLTGTTSDAMAEILTGLHNKRKSGNRRLPRWAQS